MIPILSLAVGIIVGIFGEHYGRSLFNYFAFESSNNEWLPAYILSIVVYVISLIIIIVNLVLVVLNKKLKLRTILAAVSIVLLLACPIVIIVVLGGDYDEEVGFVVLASMSFVSLGSLVLYIITSLLFIGGKLKNNEKIE